MSPTGRRSIWSAASGGSAALPAVVAAYGLALGLVGFWPQRVDRVFAAGMDVALSALHRIGGPPWLDAAFAERAANVVLFVPLGWIVAWVVGRRVSASLAVATAGAVGAATSSLIELGQAALLPARVPSAGDVVANLLGALIGAAVVFAVTPGRGRDTASPLLARPRGRARSARR